LGKLGHFSYQLNNPRAQERFSPRQAKFAKAKGNEDFLEEEQQFTVREEVLSEEVRQFLSCRQAILAAKVTAIDETDAEVVNLIHRQTNYN
jgi:hypothetical protein